MSRIPPEHEAARSLEESFRRLGEERAAEGRRERRARRGPRGWPVGRSVAVAAVGLLAASAVAAGTKVFVADEGPLKGDSRPGAAVQRAPGDRRLALAVARDPAEREPWGLRVYTSKQGRSCLLVGRIVGGRLGRLQSGRFAELPSDAAGSCGDLTRDHVMIVAQSYPLMAGGRTVLFGLADRTIQRLDLLAADGTPRRVPIAADGTYALALSGADALRGMRLRIAGTRGVTTRRLSR
ncbi:MAG: hypothetical protein QOK49_1290 [Baekduia sp.]|nr:hypothetical protein [Baekduia sp.]